jgi:FtsH-binding integral membrane protein
VTDAKRDVHPAVDRRSGFLRALYTAVRALVGGGSVVLGLFMGGMNATAYEAERNLWAFSGMAIIGGIVMIARARRPLPTSRAGWIAGAAVGVVGLLVSLVIPTQRTCCDAVWRVSLGLPLPWTTGYGDTWSQAVGEAWRDTWDPVSAILNAIFWAYAGLVVAVVIGRFGRRRELARVDAV